MGGDGSIERVALVLGLGTGGVGRHALSLAHALTAREMKVDVFCPAAVATRFDYAAAGATVLTVDASAGVGALAVLRRALRDHPPTVIHAHGLRAGSAATLARPAGQPLVVTWYGPIPPPGPGGVARRTVARLVAGAADATLGASTELVEQARRSGARDPAPILVVAPPLPPAQRPADELRDEIGVPAGSPMVLAVGRLDARHRHDILIAAASRWRQRERVPHVAIAGTGPAYRDLAAQAVLARAPVSFLGHRDDIADLLAAADLAVITSESPARPMFAQEALRAGVALITADVGGARELAGDAALLVPPGDVDALDASVRGLLDDTATRARYAAAGPVRAATWPTEEQMVDSIVAAYHEALVTHAARVADSDAAGRAGRSGRLRVRVKSRG